MKEALRQHGRSRDQELHDEVVSEQGPPPWPGKRSGTSDLEPSELDAALDAALDQRANPDTKARYARELAKVSALREHALALELAVPKQQQEAKAAPAAKPAKAAKAAKPLAPHAKSAPSPSASSAASSARVKLDLSTRPLVPAKLEMWPSQLAELRVAQAQLISARAHLERQYNAAKPVIEPALARKLDARLAEAAQRRAQGKAGEPAKAEHDLPSPVRKGAKATPAESQAEAMRAMRALEDTAQMLDRAIEHGTKYLASAMPTVQREVATRTSGVGSVASGSPKGFSVGGKLSVDAHGRVSVDGRISVDGKASAGSAVTGTASLHGAPSVDGKASVDGRASIDGRASVSGGASINGNAAVNGKASVDAKASVGGKVASDGRPPADAKYDHVPVDGKRPTDAKHEHAPVDRKRPADARHDNVPIDSKPPADLKHEHQPIAGKPVDGKRPDLTIDSRINGQLDRVDNRPAQSNKSEADRTTALAPDKSKQEEQAGAPSTAQKIIDDNAKLDPVRQEQQLHADRRFRGDVNAIVAKHPDEARSLLHVRDSLVAAQPELAGVARDVHRMLPIEAQHMAGDVARAAGKPGQLDSRQIAKQLMKVEGERAPLMPLDRNDLERERLDAKEVADPKLATKGLGAYEPLGKQGPPAPKAKPGGGGFAKPKPAPQLPPPPQSANQTTINNYIAQA